jgi:aspartyl-tRNA synthetase
MYRSQTNGELRLENVNKEVTLSGWVQKVRDKGFMIWVDLRDRYGITQLIFDEERTPKGMMDIAKTLGREFVIQVEGKVIERESKNKNIPTGEIEILVSELKILNGAKIPPFTIEDDTDGGDELRIRVLAFSLCPSFLLECVLHQKLIVLYHIYPVDQPKS